MRTILFPEVGDRVTLAGLVKPEPSVVVTWVRVDIAACRFGYRTASGEVGSALTSAIACYGIREPLATDLERERIEHEGVGGER